MGMQNVVLNLSRGRWEMEAGDPFLETAKIGPELAVTQRVSIGGQAGGRG